MKGFSRMTTNYLSGNRPRRFLSNTKLLINHRTMTGNGGLEYDPNWRAGKAA